MHRFLHDPSCADYKYYDSRVREMEAKLEAFKKLGLPMQLIHGGGAPGAGGARLLGPCACCSRHRCADAPI